MIQVRNIDHIVLRVKDRQAMQHFYERVLNCPVEKTNEEIGLIQHRAGTSLIDLVPVEGELGRMGGAAPGEEGHNVDHVCLRLDPFDGEAIQQYLRELGVDPGEIVQRYGAEGTGPSIYINDPEGNTVELKGPPEAP
ncbi:VOC family protein [Halomonas sp. M20]|uniref:VOC family protein n=1 Tax=Halomonas sp. M20 TaxID=2763264 RepID=UPI001D0AD8F4|nr:VOC family protein [Halomonas sp. M20]